MARKPLAAKPGTQANVFRPDNILSFIVSALTEPVKLFDFLLGVFPQAKRTTV